ncbi:RNA-binding protein 28 [Eupeodes corollae]|uniref:RNA-binding protein 28 n=1 Tax=Eupeodes corollae TaxID=290404 RepID=UPI002490AFC2|nr:RNA-binding protein 28 [Eupeodes corollae]
MEITEETDQQTAGAPAKRKRSNPFNVNRKEDKEKRRQKRARLIIRNISYKATEKTLREHFEKHGTIQDLNLLKRPDGKLVGCAFVQYETINQAAGAILKTSGKDFLGRTIFVDWALGKDEYTKKKGETQPKVEPKDEIKSEEEDDDDEDDNDEAAKTESDEEEDQKEASIKSESDAEENDSDDDSEDEDNDSDDDDEEKKNFDDNEDDDEDKKDIKSKVKVPMEKHLSNDVKEGCTVFIKNVPFDAEDNDLRKVCRKFGPVYYSIINRDPVSGHSKGSAFVKFKTKESADLCLASGTEFVLNDTPLDPFPALSREEVRKQADKKNSKDEHKDSRNLFLAREGLIMTGSKSAEGVSQSDMNRRHKLEQIKNQVLKNLNRFVSRNRLSIHNLPLTYDNENLRNMVITHTGFKPHECRVMRENKITAEHPKGKSKGFGFMSFTTHKEALTALRKLNNNPTVFGDTHRPIVAFSIEDRAVHKIKEKRTEKSKINNPTYKEKLEKRKEARRNSRMIKKAKTLPPQGDNKKKMQKHIKKLEESRAAAIEKKAKPVTVMEDFVGFEGKPGASVGLRSNKKIMEQAQEHKKKVGEKKRKDKAKKQKILHRIEKRQIDRTKQNKKISNRDDLSHLVNKYKNLIDSRANDGVMEKKKGKRAKWYKE